MIEERATLDAAVGMAGSGCGAIRNRVRAYIDAWRNFACDQWHRQLREFEMRKIYKFIIIRVMKQSLA